LGEKSASYRPGNTVIQNDDMLLQSLNCTKTKLELQVQDIIFQTHISFF